MALAIDVLRSRKFKNPNTCIFLLSDGEDENRQCAFTIQSYIKQIQFEDDFIINTYGYGADHNPTLMNEIAKIKNGNFYYIEEVKKIANWFILSLSGILSTLVQKCKIDFNILDKRFKITKNYGNEDLWKTKQEK